MIFGYLATFAFTSKLEQNSSLQHPIVLFSGNGKKAARFSQYFLVGISVPYLYVIYSLDSTLILSYLK